MEGSLMSEPVDPEQHRASPEEIAKLWMSENAVVNHKTAYFIAATAFMVSAVVQPMVQVAGTLFLSTCGMLLSGVTYLSIARTCTYREHLRQRLHERSKDYVALLSPTFGWADGFRSTGVLKALPLLTMVAWGVFLVSIVSKAYLR
jgi:hypothetical protein